MRGRLNAFQAAMLRWRDLYPYNAVHVIRITRELDRGQLANAIGGELAATGLTGLVLDRARQRYEYRGGPPAVELEIIDERGDATAAVCVEIERQLNRAFPATGAIVPFRFFAVPEHGAFRLGLAYDHFVAGGDSIVVLLTSVAARYAGDAPAAAPPNPYPPTFAPLLLRNAGKLARGLPWLVRVASSCRRGVRPRYADENDGYTRFTHVRLDAPASAKIRANAKAWGVTFNDLLLAVLFLALAPHVAERQGAARRREIAVASIVNLRAESGLGMREVFGQFLSSIRLSHLVPEGISLTQLAQDIHRETTLIKTKKFYLQTLLAVRANAMVWQFLNARRRRHLYAKTYPVLAGLSMFNVNTIWNSSGTDAPPPDYLRAVPTGPLAPLVVAATTCGDTLQLGFTYRRAAFLAGKIDRIAGEFRRCIQNLP
jgi:hypothetical protein